MARLGKPLPVGWGVDGAGEASCDAATVGEVGGLWLGCAPPAFDPSPSPSPSQVGGEGGLTPLGGLEETAGYKGYGLGMLVEILCAVLSGAPRVGPAVQPWTVPRATGPNDFGHCFVVLDPARLGGMGGGLGFEDRLAAYLATMRAAGERAGAGRPGEGARGRGGRARRGAAPQCGGRGQGACAQMERGTSQELRRHRRNDGAAEHVRPEAGRTNCTHRD